MIFVPIFIPTIQLDVNLMIRKQMKWKNRWIRSPTNQLSRSGTRPLRNATCAKRCILLPVRVPRLSRPFGATAQGEAANFANDLSPVVALAPAMRWQCSTVMNR